MDAAARMVVELAQGSGLPEVVNVVHPRPARWTELFTAMQAELGTAIPFVPFKEWVQQLEIVAEGASQEDLDTIVKQQLRIISCTMLIIISAWNQAT